MIVALALFCKISAKTVSIRAVLIRAVDCFHSGCLFLISIVIIKEFYGLSNPIVIDKFNYSRFIKLYIVSISETLTSKKMVQI